MSIKNGYLKKIIISFFITASIFLISLSTEAASQSDAIAVRIMPNVSHDNIEDWYAKQGFKGAPQSLVVDGYEAVRDGRTVFVNAANIDKATKKIYTNIYLISYNQESEVKTLDILGQLVSHWKFNDNISNNGYCSISTINCQADSDCPSADYICSNSSSASGSDYRSFNKGKCVLKENKVCRLDGDCPVNLFCDSLKAKTIRDISRLGKMNKISEALDSFKSTNGRYPNLDSGTYVLGSSISVWPSWKETLWSQLLMQPVTDPINSLGYCEGYEAVTCWNNKSNKFVNSDLSLPTGSYVFVYKTLKGGVEYSLCSSFETSKLGYNTAEGRVLSNSCHLTNANDNKAPALINKTTNGVAGKEFIGYLMAEDEEGDEISWLLNPVSSFSSWSGVPVLVNTNTLGYKKLYAARTGNVGDYKMNLLLTDSQGASSNNELVLRVDSVGKVTIDAQNAEYVIDQQNPTYSFSILGDNLDKKFSISPLIGSYSMVFSNIVNSVLVSDPDRLRITVPLFLPNSLFTGDSATAPFRITANNYGKNITKDINLTFKMERPMLNFECEQNARIGQPYQINGSACLLGPLNSGSYNLTYQLNSNIPGLMIKNENNNAYLTASAINLLEPTSSEVTIKVSNQYNLSADKKFNLKVNSFCGDGIKQTPNSEGYGGLNNDGNEECDGADGVATTLSSSPDKQYACTTGLNVVTPFPILNNKSCVFADVVDGGGYCGDNYCSANLENCSSCPNDCGECAPSCGDGKVSGNEVCDPSVSAPQECSNIVKWIEPPEYCSGLVNNGGDVEVVGQEACKDDCSGWGECVGGTPDLVVDVLTDCSEQNSKMYNYACCELVNCVNDACNCCGRAIGDGTNDWVDLIAKSKEQGFDDIVKVNTPNDGACTNVVSNVSVEVCVCGEPGCPSTPLCPDGGDNPKNNSCVLSRDTPMLNGKIQSNIKSNWAIYTNHTAAFYRCWR